MERIAKALYYNLVEDAIGTIGVPFEVEDCNIFPVITEKDLASLGEGKSMQFHLYASGEKGEETTIFFTAFLTPWGGWHIQEN